jgi:heptaprenyl diphosphate synthase
LIGFACEAGARLVEAPPDCVTAMSRFGRHLGRAFQMVDDLLDVVRPAGAAGKAPLTDLREQRLSLPIIYAIEGLPEEHPLVRVARGLPSEADQLEQAARTLRSSNALFRCYSSARYEVGEARRWLASAPGGPVAEALAALTSHLVDQDYLRKDVAR